MTLPASLRAVLPQETAEAWELIAPQLAPELYLAGGTGLAVHLQHRKSRDLYFFYHRQSVDLDALARGLGELGPFAISDRSAGTLNGVFSQTRVQFLHADEVAPQHLLEAPGMVAGLRVASISDIFALKLGAVAGRGELRDYFDLKIIEEKAGRRVEEGLSLFLARFGREASDAVLMPIVRSLGYFDDVDEDAQLPASKQEIATYWKRRQPQIISSLSRQLPSPAATLERPGPDDTFADDLREIRENARAPGDPWPS
jgi:hypothetical protein